MNLLSFTVPLFNCIHWSMQFCTTTSRKEPVSAMRPGISSMTNAGVSLYASEINVDEFNLVGNGVVYRWRSRSMRVSPLSTSVSRSSAVPPQGPTRSHTLLWHERDRGQVRCSWGAKRLDAHISGSLICYSKLSGHSDRRRDWGVRTVSLQREDT